MSEIKIECQEDFEILKEIEEKIIQKVDLGFDPHVLQVLDREDVSRSQIEALKTQLSQACSPGFSAWRTPFITEGCARER